MQSLTEFIKASISDLFVISLNPSLLQFAREGSRRYNQKSATGASKHLFILYFSLRHRTHANRVSIVKEQTSFVRPTAEFSVSIALVLSTP